MLGELLIEITKTNSDKGAIVKTLDQENQEVMRQLEQIQQQLDELPMRDIVQYIEDHSHAASLAVNKSDKIEQILSIVQQFYQQYASSQRDTKRYSYLLQESRLIIDLTHHYDLFGTLRLKGEPSSRQNLNYFKELLQIISQQTLQYQNQQNINRFQSEHEQVCQEYAHVIEFYNSFKELATYLYESSVRENYSFKQNALSIKKDHFKAVWTEKDVFYEEFLKCLGKFFEKFITYDINDRQYTMSSYSLQTTPSDIQLSIASKIIFDSNQISLHYDILLTNLSTFQSFIHQLHQITPQQKQCLIQSAKKNILQQIKSYIEYLLPYLPMDLRRRLLSHFSSKATPESLSIYQLLVSLRMCGKDAQLLVQTIRHIIARVQEDPGTLNTVLRFVELAKQNRKNYSMNFFVCNQMVEELEETEAALGGEVQDMVKRLLVIREEMRMKIHDCDAE